MEQSPLFFRFATSIALVTSLGLVGIALEQQNLKLKRVISLQHAHLSELHEERARLQLSVAELKAQSLKNYRLHWTSPHFRKSRL